MLERFMELGEMTRLLINRYVKKGYEQQEVVSRVIEELRGEWNSSLLGKTFIMSELLAAIPSQAAFVGTFFTTLERVNARKQVHKLFRDTARLRSESNNEIKIQNMMKLIS
ncbi:hypothetical protein [Paenibacillus sp. Soil750]|uniref:hypothetical protein n=1 Tax=Paenibacillus sp. Soil750 TaxID=1736398 RepID=UPI0006FEAAB2|nr:hypothetical protein [Paenibacillus sp. Soil750]KRE70780.1 hypothetical protein ASL11_10830 [Paenibacillus sp. Soil750]